MSLESPEVEVVEVIVDLAHKCLVDLNGSPIRFQSGAGIGDKIDQRVNFLLDGMTKSISGKKYLLRWKGGRVPSGARVGDRVITWTQHGIVTTQEENVGGTYDRLQDSRGGADDENVMLVHMFD